MGANVGQLFQGVTTSPARKFLKTALSAVRARYPRALTPCIGAFTEAFVVAESGYKPEQIEASDAMLFPSVLGFYFSGRPLAELPVTVSGMLEEALSLAVTEEQRAATYLWFFKAKQLPPRTAYNTMFLQDLLTNRAAHIERLSARLEKAKASLGGLRYELMDLRDVVNVRDPNAVVAFDPPFYRNGYTKMFPVEPEAIWKPAIAEFDWNEEFYDLWRRSVDSPSLHLWCCAGKVPEDMRPYAYFAHALGKRYETWVCNHPEVLREAGVERCVDHGTIAVPERCGQVLPSSYTIRPDSVLSLKRIGRPEALYYRDLWAHKMGATGGSEDIFAHLLDGYVFGVSGWMTGHVARLVSEDVLELFGFNAPLDKYPNANRLLMMCITCVEMLKHLRSRYKVNRFWTAKGVTTACFSKYRKLKINNGLLEVVRREKRDDGSYHLIYRTDWHERDFAGCVKAYLAELEKGGNGKAEDD